MVGFKPAADENSCEGFQRRKIMIGRPKNRRRARTNQRPVFQEGEVKMSEKRELQEREAG